MKKRSSIILTLMLILTLCLGSSMSVFANTFDGINEADMEAKAQKFANETVAGKYKLVDTDTLKSWVDKGENMIVVDTMPAGSYNTSNGHIKGAINVEVAMTKDGGITTAQKKALLSKLPNKQVLKKVSKATYKKTKKSLRQKVTKNGKTKYYKKVTVKNTGVKVIVYCGFIGCDRSHEAAAYLVKQGYTKVYRHGGGILAWLDKGYPVEKAEPTPTPETPVEPTPETPVETPATN